MSTSGYGNKQDVDLERLAAGGDKDAFAELYNRHFDRVYDFSLRLLRDADEAADVAQEAFLKAMAALNPKDKHAAFTTWILTIARNLCLNRLRANKGRAAQGSLEQTEPEAVYQQVDTDRLASPEEALEAKELAGLVWQAAAALDPKEYSLLDLHLRQGLDSGEIATMLGKSKNSAYIMLSRLKASVEESITAFIMARRGRRACVSLSQLLASRHVAFDADTRKLVTRHIETCPTCQEQRRKLVSPTAILGAFAPVPVPLGLKQQAMARALAQWTALAGSEAAKAGGILSHLFHPFRAATGGMKQAGWFAGWKLAALAAGTAVAVGGATGGALLYGGALNGGGGERSATPERTNVASQIVPSVPTLEISPTPERHATLDEMKGLAAQITGLVREGWPSDLTPKQDADFSAKSGLPALPLELFTADGVVSGLNSCLSDGPVSVGNVAVYSPDDSNYVTVALGDCSDAAVATRFVGEMNASPELRQANAYLKVLISDRAWDLAAKHPSEVVAVANNPDAFARWAIDVGERRGDTFFP